MGADLLLSAQGMSRFYNDFCAVENLTVELVRGEVLGLLGPNGAGKSTTMQMLTGNLAPTVGEIKINGIDLLEQPRAAKHFIGYLPDHPPLYRDMTVSEYLHYCAKLKGLSRLQRRKAVSRVCERCALTEVQRHLIAHLSKGYRQRVGIAQAIIHNPAVVIMDEPTVGLDPIQIQEIRALIRELGDDHAVILSTHILPEVQRVCDRVQVIHRGKDVFNATLHELAQRSSGCFHVQLKQVVDVSVLESLSAVTQVIEHSPGEYDVYHLSEVDIAPVLQSVIEREGWGLQAFYPQRDSLEQIFLDLLHQDHGNAEVTV